MIQVIWFGSWVTGLPSPGSDVDICLVLTSARKPRHERIVDYLPARFPTGIDLLVYTQEEYDRLESISPGLLEAIQTGKEI